MKPVIKIISNQKVSMTEDEWSAFNEMCRSYDRPNFKGEELSVDLFVSDDGGQIVFLHPPTTRQTSFEVLAFWQNLTTMQSIRRMEESVGRMIVEMKAQTDSTLARLAAVGEKK